MQGNVSHLITKQTNITDTGRNTTSFAESVGNGISILIKEHNTNILQFPDMQERAGFDCFHRLTVSSLMCPVLS